MCKGIVLAHPELDLLEKYKVIKKKEIDKNKVSLISGGGSGHEPAHAGYIGKGMLDAAVCGDVFASPSQIQVYQAIKEAASDKGTLLIIKNYSGDMMNFRNAAHFAQEDGIEVDYVKVDDDISVQDSLYTVGRRGVAGTVFVHKIAGAAAERGYELAEVKEVAEKAVENVKSIGFAFKSCTVPAAGAPTFELAEDEMEYGVGIHGEPGISRDQVASANELAKRMTDSLLNELNIEEGTSEVAVLINGFGSTPLQELYLFNHSVIRELSRRNITVVRTFVRNYMTAIDMEGAFISIMNLDDDLKSLLSDECDTPAFNISCEVPPVTYEEETESSNEDNKVSYEVETNPDYAWIKDNKITLDNIIFMVDQMSECIIRNEVPFYELDSHAGDGDFGMSVATGFKQLKREWDELTISNDIGTFLDASSMIIMEHCGGASGPIWGSAFRAAGRNVGHKTEITLTEFANMMQASVKGIQATGERSFGRGAVVGDKTLIDALVPYADTLSSCASEGTRIKDAFIKAAEAAVEGAKSTEDIVARMGRAGTVGERSLGHPDAGAHALGVIFTEVAEVIKEE